MKTECKKLTVEKDGFYKRYYNLKDEVDKFIKVKNEVDEIVRRDTLNRASQMENHGQQQNRNRGFSR